MCSFCDSLEYVTKNIHEMEVAHRLRADHAMFRFQLWSDLHLEVSDMALDSYVATAPYLFLAGDIGEPGSDRYRALLKTVSAAHSLVFVIAGNHEYYEDSIEAANKDLKRMCSLTSPNVIFLNNATFDVGTRFRVVGTTLWSDVQRHQQNDVSCFIADHRRISGWSVKRNNAQHAFNVEFLRNEIQRAKVNGVRLVVMTHHAPLTSGTSKPEHEANMVSSAFQTDLSHLMGEPIAIWCFGHTHHCSDQIKQGTRVVSNQRGYSENADFEMYKVFQAEGV